MPLPTAPTPPTLIVLAHLRWNHVFQRPHQLMSRLAGRWQVLYVEEPVADGSLPHVETRAIAEHLTVLVPHVGTLREPDDPWQRAAPLLAGHLEAHEIEPSVRWLTTPLAWPAAAGQAPSALVYDSMDDAAGLRDNPQRWRHHEQILLQHATLVFTGGPSLYDTWHDRHPNVHCIPSAVDVAHFAPPQPPPGATTTEPPVQPPAEPARPRLGYFGVIDDRVDLALIDTLAAQHPAWQIMMVGPVVQIDPQALPRRANIHWLGLQPHACLPRLLAGWDLCLVPFVTHPSGRSLSPTKVLEYMAGEKPVVSTPIPDVAMLYGHVVEIAEAGEPFVQACERVLAETGQARCRRAMEMLTTVSRHSWDRSADSVHQLMVQTLPTATETDDPSLCAWSPSSGGPGRSACPVPISRPD